MSEPTYVACPRCGEPVAMSLMQKRIYHGRTLSCQRCAKPFAITEATPDPVPASAFRASMAPASSSSSLSTGPIDRPLGNAPPFPPRQQSRGLTAGRLAAILVVAIVLLLGMLYAIIAPSVERARERARQASCGSNLLQIGVAVQLYAASNNGQFPVSLSQLVSAGDITNDLLVCPSTQSASYVYVGSGLTTSSPPAQVLAYEPLGNHGGAGANVLYVDGSVQFLTRNAAIAAVPQLANPATLPATSQPAGNP